MALLYVSVKTTGDDRRKDSICAIAYRWLEGHDDSLHLLTVWGNPKGEEGVISTFLEKTQFWNNKWLAIPVGVGLEKQLGWLWNRSLHYGHLDFGLDPMGRKPSIDLQHLLYLFNADAKQPDGPAFEVPPMFHGAKLERYVKTRLSVESIPAMFKQGWTQAIERSITEEANAAFGLWGKVKEDGPAWAVGILQR